VVCFMEQLTQLNVIKPERIQIDYGSERSTLDSSLRHLDKWAYDNGVTLDFSRPGKLTDNPYIEWSASAVFNGSFWSAM